MRKSGLTILLGMLLVAVITPLSQFLTMRTVNADIETASPSAWAVGFIFTLVLAAGVLKAVSHCKCFDKKHLVILYAMLTIAIPVMNLGLVRQCFLSVCATMNEYLFHGTSTYRSAYNALNPDWFPVTPTPEGLAWNKADRLLRLLRDEDTVQTRNAAYREFNAITQRASSRPESIDQDSQKRASEAVQNLSMDDLVHFMQSTEEETLHALGIFERMQTRIAKTSQYSETAYRELQQTLPAFDELEISLLPWLFNASDRSSQDRIHRELARMAPDKRQALDEKVDKAAAAWPELSANVTRLNQRDHAALRRDLRDKLLAEYQTMTPNEYQAELGSFVYRITRNERSRIIQQAGKEDTPNQNLYGFFESLWTTVAERKEKEETPTRENIRYLLQHLPWTLWVRPMLHWAALILSLFGFMMCLAEWFRRKWVDRENLAFPLVEIADNLIRHDANLEAAEDPCAPPARRLAVNPVMVIGILLGLLILSLEAAGHYRMVGTQYVIYFPFSEKVFTTGALRAFPATVFILSPILVGIAFLVSLEISFSIWVSYWLFNTIYWMIHLANPDIRDSIYTGWSGGNSYPFPMEQMLGACICFAALLVWKTWHAERQSPSEVAEPESESAYIPRRFNTAGMILFPVLALALMWNLGVTNLPFLIFIGLISLAITIAAARLRAETGLHTHHVTYEFTKLPMIFGMTGWLGTRAYTVYLSLAYLPVSLLFRALPQQLENMELARRNKVRYGTIALASAAAFVVAISVGMLSFLLFAYYHGEAFYAGETALAPAPVAASFNLARYPLWVAHFLGESGLDKFTQVHWIRVWFILAGFGILGLLLFLRGRFLNFKLHPAGYLVLLLTPYFTWVSPYARGVGLTGSASNMSLVWGSFFVAWGLKKLIIKYGGMNFYRRSKPLFVGLVIGSILAVFLWNMVHLYSVIAGQGQPDPGVFLKLFMDVPPYSPTVY